MKMKISDKNLQFAFDQFRATVKHLSEKDGEHCVSAILDSVKNVIESDWLSANKEEFETSKQVLEFDKEVVQVFKSWCQAMNKGGSTKLTPERRKKVSQRLKQGYTVEDIEKAILGCKQSPFHMGQNDNKALHNDITLICRNGSKLEQFIQLSKTAGNNVAPPNPCAPRHKSLEELMRK